MSTHSDCVRARIAIDIPHNPKMLGSPALHVGHARTVLLGSLIAQELNIPFHIRLDGKFIPETSCVMGVMCPLCTMVSMLDITCHLVYWQPAEAPTLAQYEAEFGDGGVEMARCVKVAASATPAEEGILVDDLIYHYPSLVIRGTEFVDTSTALPQSVNIAGRYITMQRFVADAMERDWHEINVPLITMGQQKLSKSLSPVLNWTFFERFERPLVQDFLLATAVSPRDPLSVIGTPFSLVDMTTESYEWNWSTWDQYIEETKT